MTRNVALQASDSRRIPGLDGLRAFAAVTVFCEHGMPIFRGHIGGYGVQLFFVLSGFLIIGGIAERSERNASRRTELYNFFVKRVVRIFPVYFLVLGLMSVTVWAGLNLGVGAAELPYHALFVTNFYEGRVLQHWLPALGHLWSLAIEEQFYLLAAPVFVFLRRRQMEAFCLGLVVLALARLVWMCSSGAPQIMMATDSIVDFGYIAWGGYLATSRRRMTASLAAIRPSLAMISFLALPALLLWPMGWLASHIAVGVLAGLVIASVAAQPGTRTVEALESPLVARFGEASYAFYLFHYILLQTPVLDRLLGPVIDLGRSGLRFSVVFMATYASARLSRRLIEIPCLRLRRRLLMRNVAAEREDAPARSVLVG